MELAADLIGTVPLFERLDASLRTRIEAITELMAAEPGQVPVASGRLAGVPVYPAGGAGGIVQHGGRWNHRLGGSAAPDRSLRAGLGDDPATLSMPPAP